MKHLKITCDKLVLFDGEVGEVSWTSSDSVVRVEGKMKTAGGQGLLDLIAAASKQKTQQAVEEKRNDLVKTDVSDLEDGKKSTLADTL